MSTNTHKTSKGSKMKEKILEKKQKKVNPRRERNDAPQFKLVTRLQHVRFIPNKNDGVPNFSCTSDDLPNYVLHTFPDKPAFDFICSMVASHKTSCLVEIDYSLNTNSSEKTRFGKTYKHPCGKIFDVSFVDDRKTIQKYMDEHCEI